MAKLKKPAKFKLSSVEVKGGKTEAIKVSWTDDGNDDSRTSKLVKHPDFTQVMNKLVNILTTYYDLGDNADDFTSFKKVNVTNYEDDKGQSVQIVGVYSHPEGKQNTTLKTAKIQTHDSSYGFENELKQTMSEFEEEVCAYIFDQKNNQGELFDKTEETEE